MDAIREQPWDASDPRLIERHKHERCVRRELLRDRLFADETSQDGELVRDYPLSYSQLYRRYEWRTVVHETPEVPNPYFVEAKPVPTHDPMSVFEEA
jgi:CRISPR system Cascade subunit CasD